MKIRLFALFTLLFCSIQASSTQKAIQLTLPPPPVSTQTEESLFDRVIQKSPLLPIQLSLDTKDTRKTRCTFYQTLETDNPDLLRIIQKETLSFCKGD